MGTADGIIAFPINEQFCQRSVILQLILLYLRIGGELRERRIGFKLWERDQRSCQQSGDESINGSSFMIYVNNKVIGRIKLSLLRNIKKFAMIL